VRVMKVGECARSSEHNMCKVHTCLCRHSLDACDFDGQVDGGPGRPSILLLLWRPSLRARP